MIDIFFLVRLYIHIPMYIYCCNCITRLKDSLSSYMFTAGHMHSMCVHALFVLEWTMEQPVASLCTNTHCSYGDTAMQFSTYDSLCLKDDVAGWMCTIWDHATWCKSMDNL